MHPNPPEQSHGQLTRADVTVAGYRHDRSTARAGFASANPSVRASALSALWRAEALDGETLLRGLHDESPTVNRRAIELSAQMLRDVHAIDEALLDRLEGDNDAVAEVAAWALGERHEEAVSSSLVERVTASLSDTVMNHHDALTREAAVAALGSIGQPGGLAAVLHATTDKATVRRRAVLALVAFEGDEVVAALHRARSDRDWQVRQAAEDLGDPE